MEFTIITDPVRSRGHHGPLYDWPPECFDGQQRLVEPAQWKAMGYGTAKSAESGYRKQAKDRGLKAQVVQLKPSDRFPDGGMAVSARAGG
jgi:hypothetical protein